MFRSSARHLARQSRIASPICKLSFAARPPHSYPFGRSLFVAQAPARAFSQSPSLGYNKEGFTKAQFESLSEGTIWGIMESVEILSDKQSDIDVEYSSSVLKITTPQGIYIINKQPPNRQIWLSSPVTGPKRFDWDPINLLWVCTRDGTTLGEILKKEIGIDFSVSVPLGYL